MNGGPDIKSALGSLHCALGLRTCVTGSSMITQHKMNLLLTMGVCDPLCSFIILQT